MCMGRVPRPWEIQTRGSLYSHSPFLHTLILSLPSFLPLCTLALWVSSVILPGCFSSPSFSPQGLAEKRLGMSLDQLLLARSLPPSQGLCSVMGNLL